jgi:hypothetical protein
MELPCLYQHNEVEGDPMNTTTQGQQFTKEMRHFLSIGTRTRRDRKGLDLHREIADWVRVAAMERGTLDPSQEESFRPAFDAASSWFKWIKLGRADYTVCEYINNLTPYQFCAFLGQMIDAGITSTSQAGQYFSEMRAALIGEAQEDEAPGQTEAADSPTAAKAAVPTGSMRRALARTRRNTLRTAATTSRALGYRTLSGHIAAAVETGRLITVGTFLDRIGGNDLPDGKRSWFGRHAAKAYRKATGAEPLRVWAQHRTTGRWIHVAVYGPIDDALYTALDTYKATRHMLPALYTEAA